MKRLASILPLLFSIGLSAHTVQNKQIDFGKSKIQVIVVKTKLEAQKLADYYKDYDSYIEKINNYTLYIVNIDKKDKNRVLKYIRKKNKDAFFINKKNFFKENELKFQTTVKNKLLKTNDSKELKKQANILASADYKTALNYFKKKDYNKSYKLFLELFDKDMGNIFINYYLGRSAFEVNDLDTALSSYDRILIYNEDNTRVRLELAQTYAKMKLFSKARSEYEEILKKKIPLTVRKRVENSIAYINSLEKKHFFNTLFMTGIMYDSNIDGSPDAGNFNVYNPIFDNTVTLQNNGDKNSSVIYQNLALLNHVYKINPSFIINTTATAMFMKYDKNSSKDIKSFSLATSPKYILNEVTYSMPISFNKVYKDDKQYQENISISPGYEFRITPNLLYDSLVKLNRISFDTEKDKDYKNIELSNKFKYATKDHGKFGFNINLGKDFKKKSSLRTDVENKYFNLLLSHEVSLSKNYKFLSSIDTRKIYYSKEDTNFQSKRKDFRTNYSLGIRGKVTNNMMLNVMGSFIDNKSNHEISDYDKQLIRMNMMFNF